jgi:aspartyl-tRNA(Asn)/glutamyl-tRNA(Gln) amidotransferase subunit C
MKIDKDLIRNVGNVARLNLDEKEVDEFVIELKEVLENFSLIDECDTSKVEPSFQPVELKNVMREDKVVPGLSQEEALSNSKDKKDGYFKGPRAV